MAFMTRDRFEAVNKINPVPKKEGFILGTDQVIYANTLFAVASDGKAYNLEHDFTGAGLTIKRVLFTDYRLEKDAVNPRVHQGGIDQPSVEGLYDLVVYLDAVGIAIGDEGNTVYAVDDHTVQETASTYAVAGKIEKVISTTYAAVYIDGLMRDVNAA